MQGFVAIRRRGAVISISIALLVLSTMSLAQAADRIMVVLDGSGSMWGQIDGKPKLEIARETLREVLQSVPETTELGLIAYGHREKGNCDDIELIVAPARGTSARIISEVDGLRFLGKTPLTAAVKMAATELRYTEDKATVVLITDGIETCDADVCMAGEALEAQGVDFTAHVVGFGLSAEEGQQVACLAENTGGQYFSANDADSLVAAMTETITETLPEQTATLDAPDTATAGSEIEVIWTGPEIKNDYIAISELDSKKGSYINYAPTKRGSPAKLTMPDKIGIFEIRYVVSGSNDILARREIELTEAEATLEAVESVAAGSEIKVNWTGPDHKNDYIAIAEVGAEEGKYLKYVYTRHGSPAKLHMPDATGSHELRYVVGQSRRTLASREIVLTGVEATLDAATSAPAGSEIKVSWTGPDTKSDYIAIADVGAEEGEYFKYVYTRHGSPAKLTMPDGTGSYEIRYVVGQSKRTLASREIELTDVEATLDAPASAFTASKLKVAWTGPDNKSDYIAIAESGAAEGEYSSYAYTRHGSPATINLPDATGSYEVRYVVGQSKRTLASSEITLTAVEATLKVINTPIPGGKIQVEWTGPGYSNDFITIVEKGSPEGSYNKYAYTRNGAVAEFEVPKALGTFEVRYLLGKSRRTLAMVEVELKVASASVSANSPVAAGSVVEVTWTGPKNSEDYIEIVASGAAANATPLSAARITQGSPLSLFAPESAGDYEIRYKMRDSGKVLTSTTLKVE